MTPWLLHAMERNKKRRNFLRFKTLMTTPGSGSMVMPANGNVGVSSAVGGSLTVTIGSRTITTPPLAANQVYNIGWIERGRTVASAARLHALDEWNRPFRVVN